MKFHALLASMLLSGSMAFAQNDPIVMTINGKPITRSAFEFSYNKNNTKNAAAKMSVDDYAALFVDNKLKVQAALDAHLDTMATVRREYSLLQSQEVQRMVLQTEDAEGDIANLYQQKKQAVSSQGGMINVAHILLRVPQQDTRNKLASAKQRIDSIHAALLKGADFGELATRLSEDKASAQKGGEIDWVMKGQTLPSFEQVVFTLKPNEISKPFLTEFGYHIAMRKGAQDYVPLDSAKEDIQRYLEHQDIRARIVDSDKTFPELNPSTQDLNLQSQEYYEAVLIYEMTNLTVWQKAQQDKKELSAFFKKNKKKYKWNAPRYKTTDGQIVSTLEGITDKKQVKKLKKPKSYQDVEELVVSDYQDLLEADWVKSLRGKYAVVIHKDVLATVNKHN